ncbi:hypothetical protein GCM10022255_075940 [Dactylosporangium darangshiense]|uniref:Uncharacterized protein n=1 Tax=Dactylosporangium darangshiense TaxID=579108 RepID=A0ABP8DJW4_9ACTN
MTRMGGSSLVTAAGPCRTHTGFPILPAGAGHLATVRATTHPTGSPTPPPYQASVTARILPVAAAVRPRQGR